MSSQYNQHNQTKIYRFTQQLRGSDKIHSNLKGTLEQIFDKWYDDISNNRRLIGQDQLYKVGHQKHRYQYQSFVEDTIEKQKVFIEIVDDSCYGCGWITKIDEIKE